MKSKRRDYFYLASVLALFLPALAAAQQPSQIRIPRIGLAAWWPCSMPYADESSEFGAFVRGLRELGYTESKIRIDCRSASKHDSGLVAATKELAQLPLDVIVTMSQPAAHAAKQATSTIPKVTIISGDPVAAGLAVSLARPGGNLTCDFSWNEDPV